MSTIDIYCQWYYDYGSGGYSMATLNVSIPDNMREWIKSQANSGKYTSASDYLRDLVRNDQRAKEELDTKLLEGLDSGEPVETNADYWKNYRKVFRFKMDAKTQCKNPKKTSQDN